MLTLEERKAVATMGRLADALADFSGLIKSQGKTQCDRKSMRLIIASHMMPHIGKTETNKEEIAKVARLAVDYADALINEIETRKGD